MEKWLLTLSRPLEIANPNAVGCKTTVYIEFIAAYVWQYIIERT
jgi:hypothetical protein